MTTERKTAVEFEDGPWELPTRAPAAAAPTVDRAAAPAPVDAVTASVTKYSETEAALDGPLGLLSGDVEGRYRLGEELGHGGGGRVHAAHDRFSDRTVALKTLHAELGAFPAAAEAFLAEARVTARLEHPGIIPVYDVGVRDGAVFYTMRVVRRRSLRDVLAAEPVPRVRWPLVRLCGVFTQICQAVSFAHSQGVLHHDLKPGNVLLGDFGEVYVADWGIATISREPGAPGRTTDSQPMGGVRGTPGYVAPEQIDGGAVDVRADLFSLGVVLYEILTGQRPFRGGATLEVLTATLNEEPTRPRQIWPGCPLALEDLCLRLLAKDPAARPASASAVTAEVEEFLEGAKDRQLRERECARLLAAAKDKLARSRLLSAEQARLSSEAEAHLSKCRSADPVEAKRDAWVLEDLARARGHEAAQLATDALRLQMQALEHVPDSEEARQSIADYYWQRLAFAEAKKDERGRELAEAMVLQHDDGRYAARIRAPLTLSVRTEPRGAKLTLYRYVDQTRRFVLADARELGAGPIEGLALSPGSYLLVARHEGMAEARFPFAAGRGERVEARIRLFPSGVVGDAFVHVPAGRFVLGADDGALNALPVQRPWLDDFAIARFPVTYREYFEFLADHHAEPAAPGASLVPLDSTANGRPLVVRDEGGQWIPDASAIPGESAASPRERLLSLAVGGCDWKTANAYCAWRSARDGCRYTLPGEAQFEKAARGADGRRFPWGDGFDPAFCNTRDSHLAEPRFEPVGAFAVDESPYGVRDLAGGSRVWIGEVHSGEGGARTGDEPALAPHERIVRGGSFTSGAMFSRAASRSFIPWGFRYPSIGIRLVKALPPSPSPGPSSSRG